MTNILGSTLPHDTPGSQADRGTSAIDRRTSTMSYAMHRRVRRSGPWPFKAEDHSALAWWRMLPSDLISPSDRELLPVLFGQLAVLRGDSELAAALHGDADAAIGAAFARMPIRAITLQTDITMTAVLNSALCGNATSALVMAQVLGLTQLDHPFALPLAASWFAHALRHSHEPDKLYQAKAVLTEAFRERNGDAADQWLPPSVSGEPDE
jgi:hypothetical protein